MSSDRGRGRAAARAIAGAAVVAAAAVMLAASPAIADGPTTFSNTTAIAIPADGLPNETGPASPFPSTIVVTGLAGLVSNVTVSLNALTHSGVNDIDVLLVAPTGENVVLLSDAGDATSASAATLTFDDAAASSVPGSGVIPTGTYRPTNVGAGDPFPAPAPSGSVQTTLAGAFTGIAPNGQWNLYIVDDAAGDVGSIAGGWSLSITTDVASVATTTVVTSSVNPSTTGESVTFTATVTAGGAPVAGGVLQFSDGATALGTVLVDAAGQATFATSTLTEGTHQIFGKFFGMSGFLQSTGSISQRVDNATVVTGTTYCNPGAITINTFGATGPYPSNIEVAGTAGAVISVTATLKGLSHTFPVDIDAMLSGPAPATNVMLMSDVGGKSAVSGIDVTFDDAAAAGVPTPLVGGAFRPTDDDADGADAFPAPAPATSAATALSTFAGGSANGTWTLWITDDASGDGGSIAGGWCLTITTQQATSTMLTSSLNPSIVGEAVTFTATVIAGGAPVGSGSVQFDDDGTPLGGAVPLAADGTAALTTSALAIGSHPITATYSGSATYAPSTASVTQVVQAAAAADAGGPYTVAEGGTLTLDASGSSAGADYGWDLDGDGDYTDATGIAPSVTWAQLEALGLDDGPSAHTIALRVTLGTQTADASASLAVANTAPTAVVGGALAATVGVPFTVKVGALDPSSADMAGMFTYTVDWGDGSPVLVVVGPADPPVSHTYAAAGTYSATFTAADKDGGEGGGTIVSVGVAAAAVDPGGGGLAGTGVEPWPSIIAGVAMIGTGAAFVLAGALLRRRLRYRAPRGT